MASRTESTNARRARTEAGRPEATRRVSICPRVAATRDTACSYSESRASPRRADAMSSLCSRSVWGEEVTTVDESVGSPPHNDASTLGSRRMEVQSSP